MDPGSGPLQTNLTALGPAFSARLVADSRQVLLDDPRLGLALRLHRTLYPLALTPAQVESVVAGAPVDRPLRLMRVGLGELVTALLAARPPGAPPVHVWEEEPALLRAALGRHDWSDALRRGDLHLHLGLDLLDLPPGDATVPVFHPLLAAFSPWAVQAAAAGFGAPRAAVNAGGLFVNEVAEALLGQGYQPWILDFRRMGAEAGRAALLRLAPRLVVAINHMVGLPELCSQLGVPLVLWEIDPSTERVGPPKAPLRGVSVFTWRKRAVGQWAAAGFPQVRHLPLAADTRLRRKLPDHATWKDRFAAPVVFVGNSLVDHAATHAQKAGALLGPYLRARGETVEPMALVEALLTVQRRELGRFLLPELLAARCPGLDAFLRRQGSLVDPAALLGEVVGAEWRLNAVAACAPFGVQVWGDAGWKQLTGRGVTHRGPAGNRETLTRIYNFATINLDIGRAYQRDIVTLRVFDVLACGGFVLAEFSEELADLFVPGVEVAVWRGLADLKRQLRHFLDHPDARRTIADRGHARVLRDHRLQDRVAQALQLAGIPSPVPTE